MVLFFEFSALRWCAKMIDRSFNNMLSQLFLYSTVQFVLNRLTGEYKTLEFRSEKLVLKVFVLVKISSLRASQAN